MHKILSGLGLYLAGQIESQSEGVLFLDAFNVSHFASLHSKLTMRFKLLHISYQSVKTRCI